MDKMDHCLRAAEEQAREGLACPFPQTEQEIRRLRLTLLASWLHSRLNPALVTGMWRWTPRAEKQDAMDVHRLSSHHDGNGGERYDPIEAAVNNVLHQREGHLGIRKEPVHAWEELLRSVERETAAEAFGKSSAGRQAVRDAIRIAARLESAGSITPWALLSGAGFDRGLLSEDA